MKKYLFIILLGWSQLSVSQETYKDSITDFIDNYVKTHEVVKDEDRKLLQFYPVTEKYRVLAKFEKASNSKWFSMNTSSSMKQTYRVYGMLSFTINDTLQTLNIYQSQDLMGMDKYKDHLFLPFVDLTSGEESYTGGRYIDFEIPDIINNTLLVDFNKAYNPYCAYVSGVYSCPIPPKENKLSVAIKAGEMNYVKKH
jgi:uncharacterized protein